MTRQRIEQGVLGGVVLIVLCITAFFTWPNYARAGQLSDQAAELDRKIGHLHDVEEDLQRGETMLAELQSVQASACRHIPDRPEVASLMNRLSMGVDGQTVLDQTFTVRGRGTLTEGARFEVLPLVVELETTFENVYDIVHRVEGLDRLVRVTSIRMSSRDAQFEQMTPTLHAAIGLDVVYEHVPHGGE